MDRNEKIFVSGLSSGGAMAMQFHVAFSNDIAGAGIIAGCKSVLCLVFSSSNNNNEVI